MLNLKRGRQTFLLPLFAPLGTVFDSPIDLCQFKSDVVPLFLGLIPLMPQNLLVLGLELAGKQRLFQQIIRGEKLLRFGRQFSRGIHAPSLEEHNACQVKAEKNRSDRQTFPWGRAFGHTPNEWYPS